MASQYGDLTIFSAREGGDPVAEREAARAEGTKKAAYLSSMDQFYAQLDFLKEVETGKREMFTEELAFKGEQLEAQEKFWGEEIALGREKIGAQEKQWQAELAELRSWHAQTLGLEREKITSTEKMFGQEFGLKEKEFNVKYTSHMKYIKGSRNPYYRAPGIGATTTARWAAESMAGAESDILSQYMSDLAKPGTPTPTEFGSDRFRSTATQDYINAGGSY